MKRQTAILYARFSPRPRAKSCESVERQLEDLRRYCMENGIRVAKEFSDKALSGADEERPGMWDAVNALKPNWTLMVTAFDRLSRDSTFALHVIRYQIEKKRAKIFSVSEPGANADTPDGRLVRSLMLAIAEYQREVTRARTRAAMRRHQRNGRRMSKICPYGWENDPKDEKRMVHNKKEMEMVSMIVMYYKQGKKLREIARMLIEKGVKSRMGGAWHHYQIRRILDREGFPPGHEFEKEDESCDPPQDG